MRQALQRLFPNYAEPDIVKKDWQPPANRDFHKKKPDANDDTHCIKKSVSDLPFHHPKSLWHIQTLNGFQRKIKHRKQEKPEQVIAPAFRLRDHLQYAFIASLMNCAVPSPWRSMFCRNLSSATYISPSPASISLVQV